jgi:hypothetical protein
MLPHLSLSTLGVFLRLLSSSIDPDRSHRLPTSPTSFSLVSALSHHSLPTTLLSPNTYILVRVQLEPPTEYSILTSFLNFVILVEIIIVISESSSALLSFSCSQLCITTIRACFLKVPASFEQKVLFSNYRFQRLFSNLVIRVLYHAPPLTGSFPRYS